MTKSVLIVDEDVNARIVAETLLRTRGLQVQSAIDGVEACEIVRREGPAVVVLDLGVPGMNGFEVIRSLRARFEVLPPAVRPRIVAVSDRTDPDVGRFALRLGADAFLHKPPSPRQLISTVEQLMTGATLRHEFHATAG